MKQKVKAVCARTMILAALCLALTALCGCDSDSSSGGGSHALDGTTWVITVENATNNSTESNDTATTDNNDDDSTINGDTIEFIEFNDGIVKFSYSTTQGSIPFGYFDSYSFDGQFDKNNVSSASGTGKFFVGSQPAVEGFTVKGEKLTWAGLTYTFYT